MSVILRSPRQATNTYGLSGPSAPRQKDSFYVKFNRNGGPQNASGWQDSLGFFVKQIDRPAIEPQLEEMNQYNKKRQITTSIKYTPIHATLYDTADSLVMNMWNDYSRWYFGDFSQDDSGGVGPPQNFKYDATMPSFRDSGQGFGYQPQLSTDEVTDQNSQFFFDTVEIYQVFGKEYTQITLVNPKISSFVPDDHDYSSVEISTISMTLTYEAILYRNNAQPLPLEQNADLSFAFNTSFDGGTPAVDGAQNSIPSFQSTPNFNFPIPLTGIGLDSFPILNGNSGNSIGGGALASFGNYVFGGLSSTNSLVSGIAGDLAYRATSNPSLSALLSQTVGTIAPIVGQLTSGSRSSISGALYDVAAGAITGAGGGSPFADSYISSNLTSGVIASAIIDNNSVSNQVNSDGGLALDSQAYGIINSQRAPTSQIGINTSELTVV